VKIATLTTTIVAVPQKRGYRSSWRRSYEGLAPALAVLVELTTDDGLVGIGESPAVYARRPEVTVALIDAVRDLIVGANPLDHDLIRRQLYAETNMAHLGTVGLSWALSGVDMAIWDLVGKAMGKPLHLVWGSAWRSRSPFYADIPPGAPEEMADDARSWVERGFRTLYAKVGFDRDLDLARVRAIRASVGDGPRIRVDANQAWAPGTAKQIINRLAEYDLEFVEQPVLASNLDEMAEVRRAVTVPILAHEASLTAEASLNVIARHAADALQLDPRFDAGFAGARTAALMAEAAGLPVVTHTYGELGVATAAVLQLHAAHRNFVLDNQTYYWNLEDDVIEGGLMPFVDGPYLSIPTGPGIGVTLDAERVAHFASLYEREVRDRPPRRADDPYYERDYVIRPRV
jgi:L-alanine-DL-glutamate epimerase-like enolase superfamily enzyme